MVSKHHLQLGCTIRYYLNTIASLQSFCIHTQTDAILGAGFAYSQTNDRLWRKNRQRQIGSSCVGRDINRNWPYQWDIAGGSSPDPCSSTYRGAAAGDATEMPGLIATLQDIQARQGVKLYIDWHSYGQLLMSRRLPIHPPPLFLVILEPWYNNTTPVSLC